MLVKLDENLGLSHVALLLEAGHQADRVHDQGLSGEADPVVWERVSSEGRTPGRLRVSRRISPLRASRSMVFSDTCKKVAA